MKRILSLFILQALLFLLVTPAAPGKVSDHDTANPYHTLWFYASDTTTRFPVVVDGDRVFLPLGQGVVRALLAKTGDLLWTSEIGGEITAPLVPLKDGVLVPLQQNNVGVLKKIDKTTGLTIWSHPLPRPLTGSLAIENGHLYAGTQNGHLLAMDRETGKVEWSTPTGDVVRGSPAIIESVIYVGSDDGFLYAIDKATGSVLWKFKTQGPVRGRIIENRGRLLFGSADGGFYSVEKKSGRLRWKRQLGAAVENASLVFGKLVVVGSYDNFLYGLYTRSGDSAWKVRLNERLAFDLIPGDGSVFVAPLRGQKVSVLTLPRGEKMNEIQLQPAEGEIVARPVIQDGLLFLTTDKGLLVTRQNS